MAYMGNKVVVGALAGALMLTTSHAMAGGFAVREQSTIGQGMSFAGSAAYSHLSAMFWNSAAAANKDGLNVESGAALILPNATLTATAGSTRLAGFDNEVDIAVDAIVPSTYISYQFKNYDPNMFLGLGVNAPFGLKTEPDNRWAGSEVAGSTSLFTLNFNPVLAYRFSEQFSVGVGAQIQYAKGILKFATVSPVGPNTYYEGESLAAGWTAGIMYTPTPSTRIGLGWRSAIDQELDGIVATNAPAFGGLFANGLGSDVELKLPDIVTLSFAQAISSNIRVMGTVEWTNWSRLESLDVVTNTTGASALTGGASVGPGTQIGTISTKWEDGWFFSLGAEYDFSKQLTLRAGAAYEISPITSVAERVASIPDADRIWVSAGLSYQVNPGMAIDFGYSHVFADDAKLERDNIRGDVRLNADLEASADIVSLGLRMKLDGGHEPLK